MGEIHPFLRWKVTRKPLAGHRAEAVMDDQGVVQIAIADKVGEKEADTLVRHILSLPRWRRRLGALPGAAAAWVRHAAGKNTSTTLAAGSVAAAGAMLSLVVVSSAPIPPQASRPAVMAPQGGPDVAADPMPVSIPVPAKPTTARPGSVPAAPRGHTGTGGLPASQGPVASALASAGLPGAGSHPLKPARQMVVTSVKKALPSAVPVPSHPVKCVVQVVLRDGKPVKILKCL